MKKKYLVIFGTRPEAIKMAPIIHEIQSRADILPIVCATAQHREMLDQVLKWFDIELDYDLNLMKPNQNLADFTSQAILALNEVIKEVVPNIILVQGDTNTAFIGALIGYYNKIPVAHIEAGLRTYHIYDPYPEEANRRMISTLATYHFTPTKRATNALLSEQISQENIFETGNTIIDALVWTLDQHYSLNLNIPKDTNNILILTTIHRRESFGSNFETILEGLKIVLDKYPHTELVFPVHLNPNVQQSVRKKLGHHPRCHLIEPLPYPAFINLMKKSHFIMTDSGGIQEEASFLGKVVLILRRLTERQEVVEEGFAQLLGYSIDDIVSSAGQLIEKMTIPSHMQPKEKKLIFGDGTAANQIISTLVNLL